MSDTYQQLTEILIKRFEVEPEELSRGVTFEELELDSLFLVELVLVIQQQLGVKISEDDATPRSTVERIAELIDAQRAMAS